jgi:hypothetical protein
MFADQPPAIVQPPPPPQVLRSETSNTTVAWRDTPLTYARAGQAERALVRHQRVLRVDVAATRPAQPDPAAPVLAEITCGWTISPYLQRDPCVETLGGQLACAESYNAQVGDREKGEAKVADAAACGLAAPEVAAAQARLSVVARTGADARFDDDLSRRLTPQLVKAGVAVRPRAAGR